MKRLIDFERGTADIFFGDDEGDDDEDAELLEQVARVCKVVDEIIDEYGGNCRIRLSVDGPSASRRRFLRVSALQRQRWLSFALFAIVPTADATQCRCGAVARRPHERT